jgi:dipeptidyl aminopeptidase/acylaminoacyl peptidase
VLIVLPPENPDAPERWVVPLPEPLEKAYTRAEISPVGDRVAWLADHPATLPKLTLLRGWPFVVTESRRRATIWLSALDGSGLRFLGRLPPQAGVNALEWDPSGASISFLHQEAIWRVPLAREVRVKRN